MPIPINEGSDEYTELQRLIEASELPDLCANCDAELEIDSQSLFCSEFCQQVAKFVRYARKAHGDMTRWNDREVQIALQKKMASLLGGGYPAKDRYLPREKREEVIARDEGRCRNCGKAGSEIDHVVGSSNDASNLQLLCRECHDTKTLRSYSLATKEQQVWGKNLWDTRVLASTPVRPCDDECRWEQEWRPLRIQRREKLIGQFNAIPVHPREIGPANGPTKSLTRMTRTCCQALTIPMIPDSPARLSRLIRGGSKVERWKCLRGAKRQQPRLQRGGLSRRDVEGFRDSVEQTLAMDVALITFNRCRICFVAIGIENVTRRESGKLVPWG